MSRVVLIIGHPWSFIHVRISNTFDPISDHVHLSRSPARLCLKTIFAGLPLLHFFDADYIRSVATAVSWFVSLIASFVHAYRTARWVLEFTWTFLDPRPSPRSISTALHQLTLRYASLPKSAPHEVLMWLLFFFSCHFFCLHPRRLRRWLEGSSRATIHVSVLWNHRNEGWFGLCGYVNLTSQEC